MPPSREHVRSALRRSVALFGGSFVAFWFVRRARTHPHAVNPALISPFISAHSFSERQGTHVRFPIVSSCGGPGDSEIRIIAQLDSDPHPCGLTVTVLLKAGFKL